MAPSGGSNAAAAAALRLLTIPVARRSAAAATAASEQAAPASAVAQTPRASSAAKNGEHADTGAFLFAWRGDPETTQTSSSLPPISAAATLSDGAVLLAAHARQAAERRLEREWRAVEEAPRGSLKGWLHRLANAVQSRSDPTEAALARIPRSLDAHSPAVAAAIRRARRGSASSPPSPPPEEDQQHSLAAAAAAAAAANTDPHHAFEIHHPASVDPRLVRRLLRRLCVRRAPQHRRGLFLWAAALPAQAPLALLPLPNVTVYYTLWRLYTHWAAGVGAQSLLAALDRLSDEQRRALVARAAEAAGAAGAGPGATTTAATTTTLIEAAGERRGREARHAPDATTPTPLPAPVLVARGDLPSPLSGPADAERLAALLDEPHIVERFSALARRMERERQRRRRGA